MTISDAGCTHTSLNMLSFPFFRNCCLGFRDDAHATRLSTFVLLKLLTWLSASLEHTLDPLHPLKRQ